MKLTVHPQRCKVPCSKPCRNARLLLAITPTRCQNRFLVLATQNPIEQEGTYPLPEAQVDRFMLKVVIGYPTKEDEMKIVRTSISADGFPKINPIVKIDDILNARKVVSAGVYG